MTTPAASGTLYASVDDLRTVLAGTDSGTGTAAKLTDTQLTLALYAASNRVSVYAGNVYDSSQAAAVPPPIFHDLALDLAAFWAYRTYLKSKAIGPTHPVYLAYQSAMSLLEEVRAGKIRLDPAVAPGIGSQTGKVINRIPGIFTHRDSNTELDRFTGTLEAAVPLGQMSPSLVGDWDEWGGAVYQG